MIKSIIIFILVCIAFLIGCNPSDKSDSLVVTNNTPPISISDTPLSSDILLKYKFLNHDKSVQIGTEVELTLTVENMSHIKILPSLYITYDEGTLSGGGDCSYLNPGEKKTITITLYAKNFRSTGTKQIRLLAFSDNITSGHPIQEYKVEGEPLTIEVIQGH